MAVIKVNVFLKNIPHLLVNTLLFCHLADAFIQGDLQIRKSN